MTEPVDPVVQSVTVTAKNSAPSDDVTVVINGQVYGGWQDVRITRGIERLPSDFELKLTDPYNTDADALQIKPGDACVVKIGTAPVITGAVDVVMPSIDKDDHSITVLGRSKCADLVDCSAIWPGGQISGASVLEVARKLATPCGITVEAVDDPGGLIPQFNLMRGETPTRSSSASAASASSSRTTTRTGTCCSPRPRRLSARHQASARASTCKSASAVLSANQSGSVSTVATCRRSTSCRTSEAGVISSRPCSTRLCCAIA